MFSALPRERLGRADECAAEVSRGPQAAPR
jgi:hypothetical protein